MKTIGERELQKTTKEKQRQKGARGMEAIVKGWELNDFVVSDFLQLICKASLIFKSSLELTLSIILKQIELYEPKHVPVECRCLKIWDLLFILICSSILVLKMMTSFANIATTTASTRKFIY